MTLLTRSPRLSGWRLPAIGCLFLASLLCLLLPSNALANSTYTQVVPNNYQFPTTAVNASSPVQTFTLTNEDYGSETFNGVTSNNSMFQIVSGGTCSPGQTLAPSSSYMAGDGGTCTFDAQYVPTANSTNDAAVLDVNYFDAIDGVNYDDTTSVSGATTQVSPSATSIDFGPLGDNSQTSQTETITNTGPGSLTVGQASLQAGGSPDFTIGTDGCSNQTIVAQGSCAISLSFAPTGTQVGSENATLDVPSSDTESPLSVSLTGTAQPIPTASFTETQDAGGQGVSFTDTSTDVSPATVTGWAWSFGDSGTSTSQNPHNAYAAAGQYTVTLTVTDSNGQTNQTSQQITVNASPAASFTETQDAGGQGINFTDTSTAVSPATPTGWAWSFGDSGTSTSQNPHYAYAAAGQYTVTLTVTDSNGQTNHTSQQVTVNASPTASFTETQDAGGQGVSFTDTSTSVSPATVTGWAWNFGDSGTSTSQNPHYVYTAAGPYTVTLTVTDSNGQTNQTSQQITVNPTVIKRPAAGPPAAVIRSPAGGQVFTSHAVVKTSFACQEGANGPGISSCLDSNGSGAPAGRLSTRNTGHFRYTVTAVSRDGQTTSSHISYTVVRPDNHFAVTHRKAQTDGSVQFDLALPGPGRIDVMESAWKFDEATAATVLVQPAAVLLQPAADRFIFARAHFSTARKGAIHLRVTPNARGAALVSHHRVPPLRIRLWITYQPTYGVARTVGYYGLFVAK
jgi:PKD repeat protein